MLIGSFHHSLQEKGRLAIPARFRESLGDNPILTQGIETCLFLLPFNNWSSLIHDLGSNPLAGADSRNLRRLLAHQAVEVEFDAQGRIIIPRPLIDWADLKKKIVVAGSIDWVEIWDIDQYQATVDSISAQSQSIAQRITQSKQNV